MHFWSKFGNPDFNLWWPITTDNSQAQNGENFDFEVKFDLEGEGQSPPPPPKKNKKKTNNRDLNEGLLHLWSKFGDPSLNQWRVITWTNLVTDGRKDEGNDNTQRSKLASGKNLWRSPWFTNFMQSKCLFLVRKVCYANYLGPWHGFKCTGGNVPYPAGDSAIVILGRELGPGGVSPNQNSRWKLAFSPLKHV